MLPISGNAASVTFFQQARASKLFTFAPPHFHGDPRTDRPVSLRAWIRSRSGAVYSRSHKDYAVSSKCDVSISAWESDVSLKRDWPNLWYCAISTLYHRHPTRRGVQAVIARLDPAVFCRTCRDRSPGGGRVMTLQGWRLTKQCVRPATEAYRQSPWVNPGDDA
jgi:hypothetical protein